MKYKIAVFDLDGTLTNSRKELTPRTVETLMQLQQSGVKVVLASGRPTFGITPLAETLELSRYGGYILAFNGAVITDCATGDVIYRDELPHHLLEPLYQESRKAGFVMLSYEGSTVLSEDIENQYVKYEAMLNKMSLHAIPSFLEQFNGAVTKALTVGDPEKSEALVNHLNGLFGNEMSVYRSEPFFVELMPLGVDKAKSLNRLTNLLSMTSTDAISFGDAYNDLSMIEWAGCGVAMANGQAEVRERADVVTEWSNDEDGVAQFIEAELLGGKNKKS